MLAANVNPATGLAGDYLNHFNEITMLLGLVADSPDMIADIEDWRPLTYEEHFERSGFSAKALAIAAYRGAPKPVRTKAPSGLGPNDSRMSSSAESEETIFVLLSLNSADCDVFKWTVRSFCSLSLKTNAAKL
jgi:hypothetical protein